MISFNIRKLFQPDYLMLVAVLGLAFYITFIPHIQYPYPLHVDEWVHLARSSAIMQAGSTTFIDPFSGQGSLSLSSNFETGFQLFLGIFQTISGISWMDIFRYFPSVIFLITVLSVYVMAQKEGFGLEAALLTSLLPTSVGIMGPALLVPVTIGLLFTPLILLLAINYKTIWSYILIFVFICFLLSIHAPSAIFPIIVLTPYILLNLKGNFKHSLWVTLALLTPFLIIFPWIVTLVFKTAGVLFTPQSHTDYVQLPRVIQTLGYVFLSLSLLGTFLLAIRGGKKNYGLVLGLLALLLMLVSFYTFNYGISILYERGLLFMLLILGIVGGAGLSAVRHFQIPERFRNWVRLSYINRYAGVMAWVILIGVVLSISIPKHLDTNYYYMIDEEDYKTFVWIRDNLDEEYSKAILDPWKATAFSAITGKYAYTRIHAYPMEIDLRSYEFLRGGSNDSTILKENGISVVYTRVVSEDGNIEYGSNNPDLVQVAKNVYILTDEVAE